MKITIVGAGGGEVTGSCYLVQAAGKQVLVDFGMHQGGRDSEVRNHLPTAVKAGHIDAVLITHAHLDHTGRLPLLVKQGYSRLVLMTEATIELTDLILRDSAKIQAQDIIRTNRKRQRAGEEPLEPLYGPEHVDQLRSLCTAVPWRQPVAVADGITARFYESGHLLGASSIELIVEEDGRKKTVVFSGDLGPRGMPIVRDYDPPCQADLVFLESTYGDREHRDYQETLAEFENIVRNVAARNGRLLVPTFAVGRAQQIAYHLAILFHQRKVKPFPVYLDSPMAIEASKVYWRHSELFDEELMEWKRKGVFPLDESQFRTSSTAEDSMKLNDMPGPLMIMAGAGMCNAGRIQHHFKQGLWKPDTHVLIVGFQGQGTLGRMLVDGAKEVSVLGDRIAVKAGIHTMGGFSAHAGQSELLAWYSNLAPSKPRVILTHGEDSARTTLAEKLEQRFHVRPEMPRFNETIDL
jgi:metallo-beta-lactamase family protein